MIDFFATIKKIIQISELLQKKTLKMEKSELWKSDMNWAFEKSKKIIELSAESNKIFIIPSVCKRKDENWKIRALEIVKELSFRKSKENNRTFCEKQKIFNIFELS